MKQCRGCLIEKGPLGFSKSSVNQDGFRSYCKPCDVEIGLGIRPFELREKAGKEGRKILEFGRIAKKNRVRKNINDL